MFSDGHEVAPCSEGCANEGEGVKLRFFGLENLLVRFRRRFGSLTIDYASGLLKWAG